jgi:hypothetical protein
MHGCAATTADAGRHELWNGSTSGEDLQALADVVAEQVQVQSAKGWRQRVEAAERGAEQARDSEGIVATLVFERGGDLNDALQEGLLRLGRREPDALPGFVGGEELAGSVTAQAFGERALGPIEGHALGRQERNTEILSEKPLRMTAPFMAARLMMTRFMTTRFSTADSKGRFDMIFDPGGRVGDEAHCERSWAVTMITA